MVTEPEVWNLVISQLWEDRHQWENSMPFRQFGQSSGSLWFYSLFARLTWWTVSSVRPHAGPIIVDLQRCVNFCCTAKWSGYTYVYVLFKNPAPLWFIIGSWIQFSALHSRALLFFHSIFNNLHLLTQPPTPSLLNHLPLLVFVSDRQLGHLQMEKCQMSSQLEAPRSAPVCCTRGDEVHAHQSTALVLRVGLWVGFCSSQSQIAFWGQAEGHDSVLVYRFLEEGVPTYVGRACFTSPLPGLVFGLDFCPARSEVPRLKPKWVASVNTLRTEVALVFLSCCLPLWGDIFSSDLACCFPTTFLALQIKFFF